jgi:hypothetical protein
MQTEYESTTVVPDIDPSGSLFGVAKNRDQLKQLCLSLVELGIREVEMFDDKGFKPKEQKYHEQHDRGRHSASG